MMDELIFAVDGKGADHRASGHENVVAFPKRKIERMPLNGVLYLGEEYRVRDEDSRSRR